MNRRPVTGSRATLAHRGPLTTRLARREAGEDPPMVMAEMGHTTPELALQIYARAMRGGEDERERLRALVGSPAQVPISTTVRTDAPSA